MHIRNVTVAFAALVATTALALPQAAAQQSPRGHDEATVPRPAPAAQPPTVVFVCEHGSVKSLIAASLLERAARERGMTVRAVSRGLDPDERVPPKIAAELLADGFDVAQFRPRALDAGDVADATRVVAIGVELAERGVPSSAVRAWNDVPPASVDYDAARTSLERHVDALLDELARDSGQ